MSEEDFDAAVADALDQIPSELADVMDNVAFFVEDEPPAEEPELLGVYDGVPLPERDEMWGGAMPDHVTIYRGPLLRLCGSRAELVDEVTITVVHEVAHHFGIDDARLHELGWG